MIKKTGNKEAQELKNDKLFLCDTQVFKGFLGPTQINCANKSKLTTKNLASSEQEDCNFINGKTEINEHITEENYIGDSFPKQLSKKSTPNITSSNNVLTPVNENHKQTKVIEAMSANNNLMRLCSKQKYTNVLTNKITSAETDELIISDLSDEEVSNIALSYYESKFKPKIVELFPDDGNLENVEDVEKEDCQRRSLRKRVNNKPILTAEKKTRSDEKKRILESNDLIKKINTKKLLKHDNSNIVKQNTQISVSKPQHENRKGEIILIEKNTSKDKILSTKCVKEKVPLVITKEKRKLNVEYPIDIPLKRSKRIAQKKELNLIETHTKHHTSKNYLRFEESLFDESIQHSFNKLSTRQTVKRTSNKKQYSVSFSDIQPSKYETLVHNCGGVVTTNVTKCFVLVAVKIRRTFKILYCIGKGIPIVSKYWLQQSEEAGEFLDPWNYILKDDEGGEARFSFNLEATLKSAIKKPFLSGYSFYITPSISSQDDLRRIIKCCGGRNLIVRPNSWPSKAVIISCVEDVRLCNSGFF
uniref:PAX-interacting protein 1 n=1 Tax=Clastoptera arizonana TaxID=38151 RepID=A0A1B6CKX6_9HEMI